MSKLLLLLSSIVLLSCGSTQTKTVDVNQVQEEKNPGGTNEEKVLLSQDFDAVHEHISTREVRDYITFLSSDELEGRGTGTPGIAKAADYLSEKLESFGVDPLYDTYRDTFDAQGQEAFNIVGVLEGSDPSLKEEYIVLGAHYDHLGVIAPQSGDSIANGANDDASGTTAVLALANYFSKNRTKRSIVFSFFSAEEKGLLGSQHIAERLKTDEVKIKAMFNIEMIGVPMQNKEYLAYLTGFENSNMAKVFNDYTGKEVLGFLPKAKEYKLFKRSDNYAFYNVLGVPAQTVSTFDFTNFDYYHKVGDEVSQMDIPFMAQVINNLIPGIKGMADEPNNKIKWNE